MFQLIKKDYEFTSRQSLFVLLYCIATPLILLLDGTKEYYIAQWFIPFFSVSFLLGKICSIEDNLDTRNFLKCLPYQTMERVGARFCFVFITLILSEIYVCLIQYFAFQQQITYIIKTNKIFACTFAGYYAIYLVLYYWFGNFIAQKSIYICFALLVFVRVLDKKMHFHQELLLYLKNHSNFLLYIAFAVVMIILFLVACVGEKKRES